MMRTPFRVLARFSADRMSRVWRGQRRVQRDELRARQQLVEFHLFRRRASSRALGGEEGVEGDDAHLQSQGARGDDRADIARSR